MGDHDLEVSIIGSGKGHRSTAMAHDKGRRSGQGIG